MQLDGADDSYSVGRTPPVMAASKRCVDARHQAASDD
jgi:hypothetical protein